ncbi:reverse transcriptase domain-containing protein, partial [Tanacetum coccineum]
MPRECLKIIESKSKVRQSRSKAVIAKVSTSSSTPAVSSDVAELKDMVRALILDKKNQTPAPAPVKAVKQSCVTCRGGHSYQNCPATDGNVIVTIFKSTCHKPPQLTTTKGMPVTDLRWLQTKLDLLVFLLFNQGQVYQPQINQPLTFQAPPYQAPAPAPPTPDQDPQFCTHKILMEENAKPLVQHQRRVNPKIHEVIKQEVIKLLDAGLIYPISNSPWVSPVHCVPKKGGITVVKNKENELIPTRLVTRWRVCIDYKKLNDATRKDHFPLPFMDQMLERLAENEYYCFLDGFSRYFQIPIDPLDQEKTIFTCPYGTFAYRRMPFGLCNAPGTFQRCMVNPVNARNPSVRSERIRPLHIPKVYGV